MTERTHKTAGQVPPPGRRCTLLLPGLLDLPATESASAFAQAGHLPEMEIFFSRAKRTRISGVDLETVLFGLFDVATSADKDLPVAAVTYAGETGQAANGWCLRADPVQLIPDRDQLVLMGPESLSLSQAEADFLVLELNTQFAADGWRIEAVTPTRWYLHQTGPPRLRTCTLTQVNGRAIGDYLPAGRDGKQWQRLMNEMQMVLHASEVNRERQTMGQAQVSSLWFWGGGETPVPVHSHWSQLWSTEPLSLGLGTLSSTPREVLPEDAGAWLNNAIAPGDHLLVLDELQRCWRTGSLPAWSQQVRILNRQWIAPLLAALRNNELDEFCIYACNGGRFTLSRSGLRRWWRRKKSLMAISNNNK